MKILFIVLAVVSGLLLVLGQVGCLTTKIDH